MNFSFVPNQGLMVDGRYITEFDVKVNRIFYYIEEDESKKNHMEYELVAKMLDGTELSPRRVKKLNNLSYFTLWTEIMDAGLVDGKGRCFYYVYRHPVRTQSRLRCII